ncbi:uncharacterized protein K452DRAFT_56302 [Aplosporella prunicola CBS 121167]|uniref:Uncharacterized protein n=1 Tax=Aplosporella prunicola CBS 121167 TaxID=1176127 RepID=A0A6A6B8C6_9PEZI|nr:uncharacterized protein K452DRAFT_56302 [Aplosporella prunicola CBS 121167]KAF2139808.1 hypothetical protein K452DRAFT_56302 [Aplosporella prunicola CBS 121167]
MAMPMETTAFASWKWFPAFVSHIVTSFDGLAFLQNLRRELLFIGRTDGRQGRSWNQAETAFTVYKDEWMPVLALDVQEKSRRALRPPNAFSEGAGIECLRTEHQRCVALRDAVAAINVPTQAEIDAFDGNFRI